jgi:hypothetical protein
LAWLGLAWLGLDWLGLAWLGLPWLGLAWLGLAADNAISVLCSEILAIEYTNVQLAGKIIFSFPF